MITARLRVHGFAISLDGYAGPAQDLDNPLGKGGAAMHEWLYPTRTFQQMFGKDRGTTGIDNDFAARGLDNFGWGQCADQLAALAAKL
jgi:hypothetical protein